MNKKDKVLSACCEKPAKPNVNNPGTLFCTQCGEDCEPSSRKAPFKGFSTISKVRKVSGEGEAFAKVWQRCGGFSEVDRTQRLLPYGDPMWHWQFSHLLPKGSYPSDRTDLMNIVATTVDEHLNEWPLAKEKTDAELRHMGWERWIPKVTLFRALRLRYNTRLTAQLSGTHEAGG
jgi:hypothetical protein